MDMNLHNIWGENALMIASRKGLSEIAKVLLEYQGINVRVQDIKFSGPRNLNYFLSRMMNI